MSPEGTGGQLVARRAALLGTAAVPLVAPLAAAAAATAAPLPAVPTWTLEGGVRMPTLALNTVGLSVADAERAVLLAKAAGVTHVDFHPGKERDGVARVIASGGRDGLFLNTKIRKAAPGTSPVAAVEATRAQVEEDLAALGVDSVDMLMLRDSPDAQVIQAQWALLEELKRAGRVRALGVINFCQFSLDALLATATVKPAVNYCMLHVGMGPDPLSLRSYGEARGIRYFAYGAAGEPGPADELLADPVVRAVGAAHGGRAPEAVSLRWLLQSGVAVSTRPTLDFGLGSGACTPDNACAEGLAARVGALDWALTPEEMATLDAVRYPGPLNNPTLFSSNGCPGSWGELQASKLRLP